MTLTPVLQRHVTRQKILNWKQSLRFPSLPRVSHEAVDLMQQLLCEPEDRLGSQTSTSVTRPNSMIVQARRSALITPSGATHSIDGAELIKASRACGIPPEPSFLNTYFYRLTHSFVELIGRIFIDILRHFVPISATLRTLGTLTTIYQLKCVCSLTSV